MRCRCARTKLQIIPAENVVDDHEHIAQRVLSKQNRYKAYHDSKPGVGVSNVKVGDDVRTSNPRHVGKGEVRLEGSLLQNHRSSQSKWFMCNAEMWKEMEHV